MNKADVIDAGGGTPEDHAEHVRRMFQAIDQASWERLGDFFSPDCVYERPGYEPIRGFAALDHFYRNVRVIERGRHELDLLLREGEHVLAAGQFHGVKRDGAPAEAQFADLYRFDEHRIAHRKTYFFQPSL